MTRPSYNDLMKELYNTRLALSKLTTDPSYNVTTRPAIDLELPRIASDAAQVVFIDLDHMHALNEKHGYEKVNSMIKRAVHVRCDDVLLRARWFSGDELVFILKGSDPAAFCARLQKSLHNEGLSATMAYSEFTGNLDADVARCANLVQSAKRVDARGIVMLAEA